MGQPRTTTHLVQLTAVGGLTPTKRIWDAPSTYPFRNVSIYVSSGGVTTAAGNLTWRVFVGGNWSGGTPFDSASTHADGVQLATGTIAGSAEIAHIIYEDPSIFPPNTPNMWQNMRQYGTPLVVSFTNAKATALTLYVSIVTETLHTNV
jgi:hypothetical protein